MAKAPLASMSGSADGLQLMYTRIVGGLVGRSRPLLRSRRFGSERQSSRPHPHRQAFAGRSAGALQDGYILSSPRPTRLSSWEPLKAPWLWERSIQPLHSYAVHFHIFEEMRRFVSA